MMNQDKEPSRLCFHYPSKATVKDLKLPSAHYPLGVKESEAIWKEDLSDEEESD